VTNVLSFDATPNAFLTMRPVWTLAGAALTVAGKDLSLDQTAFRWIDGVWEADVAVCHAENGDGPWHRLTLRIASDTARRWHEAGINPFIEACAQLKEHLGGVRKGGATSFLTLL
jgi:hypothetical protein